jgi:hypothetical protein
MSSQALVEQTRRAWLSLHTRKEDLFWEVKMGLAPDREAAVRALAEADAALQAFLQDPARLLALREAAPETTSAVRDEREGWARLFACHTLESAEARDLAAAILAREVELGQRRAALETGYVDPATGNFIKASTNRLALLIANDPDAAVRKAALDGLYAIERAVLDLGFLEIVSLRNRLGRALGYEDYYDWKVHVAERMRKREVFGRLEDFLAATEHSTRAALARFAASHGADALAPHSFGFNRAGGLSRELDPYFPFAEALSRWGHSFAGLGVRFRGATLTLDLVDRPGKYENGFMHGPGPTWFDGGVWQPARINFTANAVAGAVGSGRVAMTTLFHEGGHAAHFANITAGSPCWSNEYPPTSVALAETQSMFLDALIDDADWRGRYARDASGAPVPLSLVLRQVDEEQPFRGWDVRRLITVPMGERRLYELSEQERTPERVLAEMRAIERQVQGLDASARPILAVPHLISAESSAYYHAYVLAEMAVAQVRDHFVRRDGHLTDNPRIGPDLASACWAPGNRASHDETLVALTGRPLSPEALVAEANRGVDAAREAARRDWERGVAGSPHQGPVELDARIRVIHGPELIGDTADGGFEALAARFATFVRELEAAS